MSSDIFQIICTNCGSKLNAKIGIIGQTRNCPKCKNPILIKQPESSPSYPTAPQTDPQSITRPEVAQPLGNLGQQIENLPDRLSYHNRYFVIGSDRVVAVWESGRGWQVNVGNGFASAKKNVAAIPDQGIYAFAELVIDTGENNMTSTGIPTALNVFKISIRGALTSLYRDENEILRRIDCQWNLTKNQQTILWNHLTHNFNTETIAAAYPIVVK